MKTIITQIQAHWRGSRGRLDPLLLAARVLLYALLAGTILAIVMSVVGVVSYVIGQIGEFQLPLTDPVWKPLLRLLIGLAVLSSISRIVLHLLAMIGTVDRDEALDEGNADRLETIAGTMLGLQFLGLFGRIIGVPIRGNINGFDLSFDLSPGGIAVVLLLYILARIFRQGAAMRSDLDGTV